ncbi:MAG: hypothetical protein WCV92_00620 [Candidatus Buchananbacteria bacterium]
MDEQEQNKISVGGEDFISLSEAAKQFAFSLRYLTSMMQKGKLKVFKMGENWYTCEKWMHEHKKHITELIEDEIKNQEHNLSHLRKWVKKIGKK